MVIAMRAGHRRRWAKLARTNGATAGLRGAKTQIWTSHETAANPDKIKDRWTDGQAE